MLTLACTLKGYDMFINNLLIVNLIIKLIGYKCH